VKHITSYRFDVVISPRPLESRQIEVPQSREQYRLGGEIVHRAQVIDEYIGVVVVPGLGIFKRLEGLGSGNGTLIAGESVRSRLELEL
jgi:hypothetical protein